MVWLWRVVQLFCTSIFYGSKGLYQVQEQEGGSEW